jgi:hypothetical protein
MRLRTAAWILLAAAPVLAGVPEKGDGTITMLGGLRAIPGGQYQSDSGNKHGLWHPGFLLGLGFQPDDELHGSIQLGYGLDQYGDSPAALKIRSFQILLGLDTALFQRSWCTLYAGGGRDVVAVLDHAGDPSTSNTVNMGGNLLSAGILFHFFSPDDKGHPTAPGG